MRVKPVALLLCTLSAAPLAAENLLANPEFDTAQGLGSWQTNATGSWSLDADSARCAQSGSALGTSATSGGGDQYLTIVSMECIAVDPAATPSLDLAFSYRTTAQVWARGYLQLFTDGACGSHLGWSAAVYGDTSAAWSAIAGAIPLAGSAASVLVWIDFNPQVAGIPPFTAGLDRIWFGSGAPLFEDAFEAEGGSTCRWGAAQGEVP